MHLSLLSFTLRCLLGSQRIKTDAVMYWGKPHWHRAADGPSSFEDSSGSPHSIKHLGYGFVEYKISHNRLFTLYSTKLQGCPEQKPVKETLSPEKNMEELFGVVVISWSLSGKEAFPFGWPLATVDGTGHGRQSVLRGPTGVGGSGLRRAGDGTVLRYGTQ